MHGLSGAAVSGDGCAEPVGMHGSAMMHQVLLPIVLVLFDGRVDAEAAPSADRVQAVRKTYAQVPATILDVAEPITLGYSDMLFDGGPTMFVNFEDANGKGFCATLSRPTKDPFPEKYRDSPLQIGQANKIASGKPLLLRGPEEAALYGLLIRWSKTKTLTRPDEPHFPKRNLYWADHVLVALDFRFGQVQAE